MSEAVQERSLWWWILVVAGTLLATTLAGIGLILFFNGLPPRSSPPVTSRAEPPPLVTSETSAAAEGPIKDTVSLLNLLVKDLDARPESQARLRRFLSFVHLSRLKTVTDEEHQSYQAALRGFAALYKPAAPDGVFAPLDAGQTVYGFDLGDLNWADGGQWAQVLKVYPYGLHHPRAANRRLPELELQVERATGSPLPWVRGDWFLAAIGRPPLGGPMGALKLPGPLPESFTALAESYRHRELDAEALAADLGFADVKRFEELLANESDLRRLVGFENAEAKTVRREQWETFRGATSPFQDTARQLGLGTPYRLK
jgi:hypothetical protein